MSELCVYCCGGAGANIAAKLMRYAKKQETGFSKIKPVIIDTSRSNINAVIPAESIYLVDDLDGSGKKRDSNYTALSEASKDILHQHKPTDINVILHSASGGSGSVIVPILVSELLSRGENVIVIMVGSTGSRIEAENTLKTLKSYEVISKKRESPVVAYYRENSKEKPRGIVDDEIQSTIVLLATIFSGDNRELDSADLHNWINYQKVTSYKPKLSLLEICTGTPALKKGEALISMVTLADDKSTTESEALVEYHTVGYVPESAKSSSYSFPIHACVVAGFFTSIVNSLESKLSTYDEHRSVVIEKSIAENGIDHTTDGLVL